MNKDDAKSSFFHIQTWLLGCSQSRKQINANYHHNSFTPCLINFRLFAACEALLLLPVV